MKTENIIRKLRAKKPFGDVTIEERIILKCILN